MPKSALIYTLGNSDILINGSPILEKKYFRKETNRVLKDISNSAVKTAVTTDKINGITVKGIRYKLQRSREEKIILPIFSNFLSTLIEEECSIKLNDTDFYIFYTDQGDSPQNVQDTLYLSEIVKHFLNLMNIEDNRIHLGKIPDNPTNFSKILKFFKEFMKEDRKKFSHYEDIFLAVGPGTPQMMMASLFSFSNIGNVTVYYIPRNQHAQRIDVLKEIRVKETLNAVAKLAHNYDYGAAYLIYSKDSPLKNRPEEDLLKSVYYRTNFEFENAYESFKNYWRSLPDDLDRTYKDFLSDYKQMLYKLREGDKNALLKELYYEFTLRILSERYLEAVAMVFRFQEEILKRAVENHFGITVEKQPGGDSKNGEPFAEFKNMVRKNETLKEFLVSKDIKWEKGDPNRFVFAGVIEYILMKDKNATQQEKGKLKKLLDFHKWLEDKSQKHGNLLDIRNSSPYAHGFNGVHKDKIEKVVGMDPTGVVNEFRKVLKEIGVTVEVYTSERFPFYKLNRYIETRLSEI